ncbi:uncharacterized protein LOC132335495 [Haemorhous mexicanus]|uniref:uncharacterized protein LOC132335495 n=1 Tax=Haemorhous mexicanus TaxID=30427 RepID=UPI0028BD7183|nr:uncharacterized protein LOC132335495 [Haemorhous mexicanus]
MKYEGVLICVTDTAFLLAGQKGNGEGSGKGKARELAGNGQGLAGDRRGAHGGWQCPSLHRSSGAHSVLAPSPTRAVPLPAALQLPLRPRGVRPARSRCSRGHGRSPAAAAGPLSVRPRPHTVTHPRREVPIQLSPECPRSSHLGACVALPKCPPCARSCPSQVPVQLPPGYLYCSHPAARAVPTLPDFGALIKRAPLATVIDPPTVEEGAKLNVLCLLRGCPSSSQRQLIPLGLPFYPEKHTARHRPICLPLAAANLVVEQEKRR